MTIFILFVFLLYICICCLHVCLGLLPTWRIKIYIAKGWFLQLRFAGLCSPLPLGHSLVCFFITFSWLWVSLWILVQSVTSKTRHQEDVLCVLWDVNPLEFRGSYVPHRIIWNWYTSNTVNMKLVHQQYGDWYTSRWWVGCHICTARRWLGGAAARPGPSLLYQM